MTPQSRPRPVAASWSSSSTRERSGGTVTSDAAFPLRRARVPLGIGVGVIQHSGLRDLRVHSFGPGVWSELTLQVTDGLTDDLAGLGEAGSSEAMVVLDHPAVDHDRVHIAPLRLEGDVPVGVQQREHDRGIVVLDEDDVSLLARLECPDDRVEAQRLRAAARGKVDYVLCPQVTVRDRKSTRLN